MVLVLGILIAPLSGLKCPYMAIKHNNIGYVIIVSHGITLHQVGHTGLSGGQQGLAILASKQYSLGLSHLDHS